MQTVIGTDILEAARLLRSGELVAIPTETVYGLAANAGDENAVLKIYAAKNRPRFNPLILHVADAGLFPSYTRHVPEDCIKLAEAFAPGPITFLLDKNDLIPDLVTAGSSRVAIRVPSHPVTLSLLHELDFPLAAPSANPSGYISPVTAVHVYDGLHGKIPYILDGGPCAVGLESTIVGFELGKIVVHRLGGITREEIERVCGKPVTMAFSGERPDSPGQLKSHYAPRLPLLIGDPVELMHEHAGKKVIVISFRPLYLPVRPLHHFILSETGDLNEAARNIFRVLHEADRSEADLIIATRLPDLGMGAAVNDRLDRAQSGYRESN
jgi:L-threonylcarbamoyladenylate synthase